MRKALFIAVLVGCVVGRPMAQGRIERNVVYGMYSGLALLMDVYHSAAPNGRAVVLVLGSAFSRPLGYDAPQLKDAPAVQDWVKRITEAGYTVFVLNHRATPRFQDPAPVEDVQRAVRFIRANAYTFRIDPSRVGAAGGASGGHLVSMLGTLDGAGDPADPDPVNRLSAKVQAVAALFTPVDLSIQYKHSGGVADALFVGASIDPLTLPTDVELRRYAIASPTSYVTPDDAPFLLIHGDKDATVPIGQSVTMEAALRKVGVDVKFIVVPGGGHGRNFGFAADDPRLPKWQDAVVQWFDAHLR